MDEFKGVPVPVSLRDRDPALASYEAFWWREGVRAAIRHIKPAAVEPPTEEELTAAVALVATLLLTYSIEPDDPETADMLAREIVKGLTQDERL